MTAGTMLLTITAVLVFCGLLQRVLDRMYLTDRQALLLVSCMLAGTFLPNISLGALSVNIGGAVIPLGICMYLLIKANKARERWRTLLGILLTAIAVYIISKLLPAEAEHLPADPIWLYGVTGGLIAWLIGRSRRGAFICGVAGVILGDVAVAMVAYSQGYQTNIALGGAGIADACVISGVMSVLFCELVGEFLERLERSRHGKEGSKP